VTSFRATFFLHFFKLSLFFESSTGEPALAAWCHCSMCRKNTGAAMQLGGWGGDNFVVLSGDDSLINYKSSASVTRHSCKNCGSFCYKSFANGTFVCPLGMLDPVVAPTCHIYVASRGNQAIMFPELPQYDEFPP
jgi:hypothetical protein